MMEKPDFDILSGIASRIYIVGVKAVTPGKLIPRAVGLDNHFLRAGDFSYDLQSIEKIWVIGAGKASAAMGHYLEGLLGDSIAGGYIVTRRGCYCRLKRITVAEAGHPYPDTNSFIASEKIRHIAESAQQADLVICLWSGGGSALIADSPESISADDYRAVNRILVRCGASIQEINSVRKHISITKGGQLARLIWPATAINILISDVPGDDADVIASGPTVPDNSTFHDALNVVRKYDLWNQLPESVIHYLNEGAEGRNPETPKHGDSIFSRQNSIMAGTNLVALTAARSEAMAYGYETLIITSALKGNTNEAADYIFETIKAHQIATYTKPFCLLFGGETTVNVQGSGKGGRNQHLALTLAGKISDTDNITILVAGTDGSDGETDATGAIVNSLTIKRASEAGIDANYYLGNFDSWSFFKKAGGHVITGSTFTNVMDIVVVLIGQPAL